MLTGERVDILGSCGKDKRNAQRGAYDENCQQHVPPCVQVLLFLRFSI